MSRGDICEFYFPFILSTTKSRVDETRQPEIDATRSPFPPFTPPTLLLPHSSLASTKVKISTRTLRRIFASHKGSRVVRSS